MTVSEWANAHVQLPQVEGPEHGRYRWERTPYCREVMDQLSATSRTAKVICQWGTQLGKTRIGLNWLGYIMHLAPAPTLMVVPTVRPTAERMTKQRIGPMIEATPVLRERVREARSRDSGNTLFMKEFPGGAFILAGANSAAALKSMPIQNLYLDEIDEFPGDLEDQGDAIALAEARQQNFPRRKTLATSTPTVHGASRIEQAFLEESDQRHYFVPCPQCGNMDWIRWENIRWENHDPQTARLVCVACGAWIEERHKTGMLLAGEWRALAPGPGKCPGYHLSALYSPLGWKSWETCVAQFLASHKDPVKFKVWWNTVLALAWEERGQGADADSILARTETYFPEGSSADVPRGVGVLVGSVDVQGDRLEAAVKGFGAAEESWLIAYHQEFGDPALDATFLALDQFLSRGFLHESGRIMHVACVAVDVHGGHADQVYKFCKARLSRRYFAVRGGNDSGKPLVGRPTRNNRYRAELFTLCVNTGKSTVYSRLQIARPGPGYMHFPDWIDEEYSAQLTAEKGIRKDVPGRGAKVVWTKIRERNEALDLEVYCLAALQILGEALIRSLPELAALWALPPHAEATPAARPAGPPLQPPRAGWVDAWRQ